MAHGIDVSQFVAGQGVLDLRGIAVKPGGTDDGQSLRPKLRPQLRDDGSFRFAVHAPVRPEKQQHWRTLQLGEQWRL